MLSLGLDTSTRLGSVALAGEEGLLGEVALSVRATHSETVMPEVRRLLRRAGRTPRDIDRLVVGAGPGSFTGVRIAASLAKGLRAATGAELLAYSSLAALAAGTGLPGRVCALCDARREEVYAAAYPTLPPLSPTLGPAVVGVEELLDVIGGEGWTFLGDGAGTHQAPLEEAGGRVLGDAHRSPRASVLLQLARYHPEAGRVEDPATWEPRYVRASGAERGIGA